MRLVFSAFFVTLLAGASLGQLFERGCECNYGGVWLDIIALIDNSAAMTLNGLSTVAANLATVAGQLNISQNIGQYTRIGLVTYNSAATVQANLTTYSNVNDLNLAVFGLTLSSNQGVNIEAGLQAATRVISNSHVSSRQNVKTVILLYAGAYSSGGFTDPKPAAEQIKESGTPIITVAFAQADTSNEVTRVAELSSPLFAFNTSDRDITNEILEAFCQVNCFCPANWVQLTNNYDNPTRKLGECLRYQDIDAMWTAARFACQSAAPGGFLYNEFSSEKHDFVDRVARNSTTYDGNGKWHMGLSYDGSIDRYVWERPYNTQVPLETAYSNWDAVNGYPTVSRGNKVRVLNRKWQNEPDLTETSRYVCQQDACDTANYCS